MQETTVLKEEVSSHTFDVEEESLKKKTQDDQELEDYITEKTKEIIEIAMKYYEEYLEPMEKIQPKTTLEIGRRNAPLLPAQVLAREVEGY
jgi:hypothetical protein